MIPSVAQLRASGAFRVRLVMVHLFIDDTQGERFYGLAGFASSASKWNAFQGDWRALLVKHNLPHLHTADFFAGAKPYPNRDKMKSDARRAIAFRVRGCHTDPRLRCLCRGNGYARLQRNDEGTQGGVAGSVLFRAPCGTIAPSYARMASGQRFCRGHIGCWRQFFDEVSFVLDEDEVTSARKLSPSHRHRLRR